MWLNDLSYENMDKLNEQLNSAAQTDIKVLKDSLQNLVNEVAAKYDCEVIIHNLTGTNKNKHFRDLWLKDLKIKLISKEIKVEI